MREAHIKHENGDFWVGDTGKSYTVYRAGITHSTPDSSYAHTADGLSIAIARCNYLAKRAQPNTLKGLGAARTKDPQYGDWSGTRRRLSYGQVPPPEEFIAAFREEVGRGTYEIKNVSSHREANGKHTAEDLYMLVVHLADEFESEGDEEAGSLASSILSTLGFEWV